MTDQEKQELKKAMNYAATYCKKFKGAHELKDFLEKLKEKGFVIIKLKGDER